MTADGRILRGDRTRAAVLDRALELASTEGLGGLTLAGLADAAGLSKSALFAHWRTKEALQLAVVDHARRQWIAEVIDPALAAPAGVRRLWAVHDARMTFYESGKLPGACFFAHTYVEYNARAGTIRERLDAELTEWTALLARLAGSAVRRGDLRPDTDATALAHLTDSLGVYAAMQTPVLGAATACGRSRQALLSHLTALTADPSILPELT